jgi:hypothetical protein
MNFNPIIQDEDLRPIALVLSGDMDQPTPEEALTHANIIAKAPEMKAIIQELAELDGVTHPIELTRKAKILIKQII